MSLGTRGEPDDRDRLHRYSDSLHYQPWYHNAHDCPVSEVGGTYLWFLCNTLWMYVRIHREISQKLGNQLFRAMLSLK